MFLRWFVVIFIALAVFPALLPWLQKLGVWRVPGDVRFKIFGLLWCLPFGSAVVVSAIAFLLAELL